MDVPHVLLNKGKEEATETLLLWICFSVGGKVSVNVKLGSLW